MKQIKMKDLPETLQAWLTRAIAGKAKSGFVVYGFNSRFIILKKLNIVFFEAGQRKKLFEYVVIEWTQQNNLNRFLFKKIGGLTKADKAKVLKDFSINLTVERK